MRLNTTVHVHIGDGKTAVYGPGDEVPAELAQQITNPDVWADTDSPSEAWTVAQLRAYATSRSIDLGDATKKADILAVITGANG